MVQQSHRPQPSIRGCGGSGIIGGEELNQGGGHLFGGPAGPLTLEGMPVAVADAQLTVQPLGQGQRAFRPGPPGLLRGARRDRGPGGGGFGGDGGGCHWTFGRESVHPVVPGPALSMLNR